MPPVIVVHSFHRGVGKSHLTANLAALLARQGQRIAVLDASLAAPDVHLLFGLDDPAAPTLNDYLAGRGSLAAAAHDVTARLGDEVAGRLYLIPASPQAAAIHQVVRQGYDVQRLHEGLAALAQELRLDGVLIDSYPGLSQETLSLIAVADVLGIVLQLDQQDYQGTAVTVDLARRLGVPRLALVVNKVPPIYDPADVARQVAQTYSCEVAAVLPHADAILLLASRDLFVLRHPDHPLTARLTDLAARLVAEEAAS